MMKQIAALLLLTLVMTGCFFSTKNSTFYLLESRTPSSVISSKKISVGVQDVTIPDYLDRPQIVLQKQNDPQIYISEFDRWASDLPSMVQNTLIEDLQQAFPKGEVKPLLYGSKINYVVKVVVDKMGGFLSQGAYLKGSWQIVSPNGKVLRQGVIDLNTTVGKTYHSYVMAQSVLLSRLAEMLCLQIEEL